MRRLLAVLAVIIVISMPISVIEQTHSVWNPKQIQELVSKTVIVSVTTEEHGVIGTGVFISKDGLILTAAHVVDGKGKLFIEVVNTKFNVYECEVVNMDTKADLALIQVKQSARKFDYVNIQRSDKVLPGQDVLVIGHPEGDLWTISNGIITRVGFSFYYMAKIIETNAHVHPGSSGGPMLNSRGELIGIISAMQMGFFGLVPTGIGYAVHIKTIHSFLAKSSEKIKAYQHKPPRYRLGDVK